MRILLAVDGSRSADHARNLVAAMPLGEGGRVRIVTVAPTRGELLGGPRTGAVPSDAGRLDDEVVRFHREALIGAEREIRAARADLFVEPILVRGRAASVIVDQACDMEADLVVVGHRGQGRWESALLGSVSREVVDHAPCPVLVARDERLGPVLLVDDGSPPSLGAEGLVSAWSLLSGLPVTVVTVTADGPRYAAGGATALEADRGMTVATCAAATARLRAAGVDAIGQVREGDPAQQIIKVARERRAGLIVIGTRGQTGLRRLVLGGVARNILLHAPCSVLVVREVAALDGRRIQRYREEQEIVSAFG